MSLVDERAAVSWVWDLCKQPYECVQIGSQPRAWVFSAREGMEAFVFSWATHGNWLRRVVYFIKKMIWNALKVSWWDENIEKHCVAWSLSGFLTCTYRYTWALSSRAAASAPAVYNVLHRYAYMHELEKRVLGRCFYIHVHRYPYIRLVSRIEHMSPVA